ncbi:MAG: hypothetical protein RSE13_06130 [Planktothrix sp. GU0601_MAG3]|nr:MAG: hypothetical protein RSE13_06130 [Planktothrix sp. GU0601_MAG3]
MTQLTLNLETIDLTDEQFFQLFQNSCCASAQSEDYNKNNV